MPHVPLMFLGGQNEAPILHTDSGFDHSARPPVDVDLMENLCRRNCLLVKQHPIQPDIPDPEIWQQSNWGPYLPLTSVSVGTAELARNVLSDL
jgi:hypothetical protein